jgi:predicted MFS family arabinose efflux permease
MHPHRRARAGATGTTPPVLLLLAAASGLAVSSVYAAQPLLDEIARDLRLDRATVGIVVTVTQIAYGAGLLLIVPLADVVDRRRMVTVQALLLSCALVAAGLAGSSAVLLLSVAAIGALAVLTQVLVALAASLSAPDDRGRAVGTVTSGVITGILLSRTVAGGITEMAGWRAVYLTAALLCAVIAIALTRVLPPDDRPARRVGYGALVASVVTLVVREPRVRSRAVLALLTFVAFSTLWSSLALPLSDRSPGLSPGQIGLFGLAGAAGAAAAIRAGHWADRGHAQRTTGIALVVLALSWLPIALLDHSLGLLVLGLLLLDGAVQAIHVSNQALIYPVAPDALSSLTAGYMVCYSVGSAGGAIASSALYAAHGWTSVCLLGAAASLLALGYWAWTARPSDV